MSGERLPDETERSGNTEPQGSAYGVNRRRFISAGQRLCGSLHVHGTLLARLHLGPAKALLTRGKAMKHSHTKKAPITPGTRLAAPLATGQVPINNATYRRLVEIAGITNSQMARYTGMSESYSAQVRAGTRTHVSANWLMHAAAHLAVRLGEPARVTALLMRTD